MTTLARLSLALSLFAGSLVAGEVAVEGRVVACYLQSFEVHDGISVDVRL